MKADDVGDAILIRIVLLLAAAGAVALAVWQAGRLGLF